MSLSPRLHRHFPDPAVRRGRALFVGGRVSVAHEGPDRVVAAVQDGSIYRVEAAWTGRVLRVSCSCSGFELGGPCRHLWACLLLMDDAGLAAAVPSSGPIRLVADIGPLDEPARRRLPGRRASSANGEPDEDDEPEDCRDVPRRVVGGSPRPSLAIEPVDPRIFPRLRILRRKEEKTPHPRPIYVLDRVATLHAGLPVIDIWMPGPSPTDPPVCRYPVSLPLGPPAASPDRAAARLLLEAAGGRGDGPLPDSLVLSSAARLPAEGCRRALRLLCMTGRLRVRVREDSEELMPTAWNAVRPWRLHLEVRTANDGRAWVVRGRLSGGPRIVLPREAYVFLDGCFLAEGCGGAIESPGAFEWASLLFWEREVRVPVEEEEPLLDRLWRLDRADEIDWPDALRFARAIGRPRPSLAIRSPLEPDDAEVSTAVRPLRADLSFLYAHEAIRCGEGRRWIVRVPERRLILRNEEAEGMARHLLHSLGFRSCRSFSPRGRPTHDFEIHPLRMPRAVRDLVLRGWHVEAEGKLCRSPGRVRFAVSTGVDWLDLGGTVEFDGFVGRLPPLLDAVRRGDGMVLLDDGSFGVLPEEWLKKHAFLASFAGEGGCRFPRRAGALLAALLEGAEVEADGAFEEVRRDLAGFEGVEPQDPPPGFSGELRPYQRAGLGWLRFLERFGFGGCLADDMGLGKTVQTLALMESRAALRRRDPEIPACLLVVPRSLITNWKREAARFAPGLDVLDHTGIRRARRPEDLGRRDLILTTYGILRRDIDLLEGLEFDYVILDEAQAIKEARSGSARAARRLRAAHRLALSGTPIENRIEELWSLFEFLNPGMLGKLRAFRRAFAGGDRQPVPEARALIARAVRPFVLRRTKEQVVPELPEKSEQIIFCDLDPRERNEYVELRNHYRRVLRRRLARCDVGQARASVLAALLRLRQAACHPGLLDRSRLGETSTKLGVLLERLEEARAEGHKALVFSQFTRFLAIVRKRLDDAEVPYEYLDGQTIDRGARVDRFQSDPDCPLFLISLKAGGLGLNLTAADYVFLLDPWWNPAAEAQAIDRAHRIGQSRPVLACRLIARGTVEEKVLELQATKRELAEAIVGGGIAGPGGMPEITREDLELLLS